jgi:hypothetical protein
MKSKLRHVSLAIMIGPMCLFFTACEEESQASSWKSSAVPGVYSRRSDSGHYMEVANQTGNWATAFAYCAEYSGTTNLQNLISTGTYVQHVTIQPFQSRLVRCDERYSWVWVMEGKWKVDWPTKNIVPDEL